MPAHAAEKTPEALEQEYQSQKNPRKRAEIARDLIAQRLSLLREFISTGTMFDESSVEITNYDAALERLASAVREAQHNGTYKNSETFLRMQGNALKDLLLAVSASERPLLEELLTKIHTIQDEVLEIIMHPPEKK